jgi:hypothetical protein
MTHQLNSRNIPVIGLCYKRYVGIDVTSDVAVRQTMST